MNTSQLLRQRLRRDLHEIQANADHGFSIHPASQDMRRLCLHICPESGPFAYLRLHFSIELPFNYVSLPHLLSPQAGRQPLSCCDVLYYLLRMILWHDCVDVELTFSPPPFSLQPTSPPRIWSTVQSIQHPNILENGYVCCDLFRESAGGYTGSAYVG
jgi:ubiquitin-protein ligase